jgi:hypothetical protein
MIWGNHMNKFESSFKPLMWFIAILLSAIVAACGGGGGGGETGSGSGSVAPGATAIPGLAGSAGAAATNPTVGSSNPGSGATNVPTSTNSKTGGVNNTVTGTLLTATFSEAMNPATITSVGTFTLKNNTLGGIDVPGVVTMNAANTIATFTPGVAALNVATSYTATITVAAKNASGTAMPNPVAWSFTTAAAPTIAQAPVNLGTAENFVILTKSGITNVHTSAITGNIGASPITAAAMDNVFCSEITGTIYGVDAAYTGSGAVACFAGTAPDKTLVDLAVVDMETAMVEAAGRTAGTGPFLNIGGGTVTSQTLAPGVYTWGVPVNITGDITLSGSATDVWIFQMSSTLDTNKKILLTGGALAKNVFWRVAGVVTLQATTEFTGIVMGDVTIALITGAKINGRMLSKTAVTLQANTVTPPAP